MVKDVTLPTPRQGLRGASRGQQEGSSIHRPGARTPSCGTLARPQAEKTEGAASREHSGHPSDHGVTPRGSPRGAGEPQCQKPC